MIHGSQINAICQRRSEIQRGRAAGGPDLLWEHLLPYAIAHMVSDGEVLSQWRGSADAGDNSAEQFILAVAVNQCDKPQPLIIGNFQCKR
jgi:hypothetical protein